MRQLTQSQKTNDKKDTQGDNNEERMPAHWIRHLEQLRKFVDGAPFDGSDESDIDE